MRCFALAVLVAVMPLVGCANNPLVLQQQNQTLQTAQATLQQRANELQARATSLDTLNQNMEMELAKTRQQSQVLQDQLAGVSQQLATTTAQLVALRDEKHLTDKQTEALLASTRRKAGATITANNSLQRSLPAVNIPGIEVRQDGDVVRVELPCARLFQPGNSMLQPVSVTLLDSVAMELARAYPDQRIGIEGHTDDSVTRNQQGLDSQQISVAQATAVYMYLAHRGTIPSSRLFIVGHGPSDPVVSNATAAGKARNNRIELVVYPERTTAAR